MYDLFYLQRTLIKKIFKCNYLAFKINVIKNIPVQIYFFCCVWGNKHKIKYSASFWIYWILSYIIHLLWELHQLHVALPVLHNLQGVTTPCPQLDVARVHSAHVNVDPGVRPPLPLLQWERSCLLLLQRSQFFLHLLLLFLIRRCPLPPLFLSAFSLASTVQ